VESSDFDARIKKSPACAKVTILRAGFEIRVGSCCRDL
jgi:hypothetical protein